MKRLALVFIMLLSVMSAVAQTRFVHTFGIGTGISFADGYVLDACPEFGFGYDFDGKNTIGVAAQAEIPYFVNGNRGKGSLLNVFLFHDYYLDVFNKPGYLQYEIGLADITRSIGAHVGLEWGFRFNTDGKAPIVVGLSVDGNDVTNVPEAVSPRSFWITAGLVFRVEL